MKKSLPFFLALFGLGLFVSSCGESDIKVTHKYYEDADYELMSQYLNIPSLPLDYTLDFPDYYPSGAASSFDADKVTLGRVLFYDKNLSEDREVSCASCHSQETAFSDNKTFSDGTNGNQSARNSLALGSVFSFNEYYGTSMGSFGAIPFLWDNRAPDAATQARMALEDENEMGLSIHDLVDRVNENPYYEPLYKYAYGYGEMTEGNLMDAIAQFIGSIATFGSKYDDGLDMVHAQQGNVTANTLQTTNLPNFTASENLGKVLYSQNCSSCHGYLLNIPAVTSANNGLATSYEDSGIGGVTGIGSDIGKFKVPTLRNIALTHPYMHDGSLATLEDVVEHYSSGIQAHPNLSSDLKNGGQPRQMNFSAEEKQALVDFLHTLTDPDLLAAEKYSDPFK